IRSPWSEESPAINVGAEYRKDTVDFEPDQFSQSGDVAGFSEQIVPIRGSIVAKEVFGEARVPLVTDRFRFETGFRRSSYDNGSSTFSTNAYKLALDVTAVAGLLFRASQQRANGTRKVQELVTPIEPGSFQ